MAIAEPTRERPGRDSLWADLLARIANSDPEALADLYDLSSSLVFGLVLRVVGDRATAEEVTLDVYTQVWQTAVQYRAQRGSPATWLLMLARSRAIDCLRSKAWKEHDREQPLEATVAEFAAPTPTPEEISVEGAERRMVQSALASLDPKQREAILLSFFSGLSHTEIAARLGQPLGTVKTRIRLGMARLRETLQPQGGAS